MCDPDGNIVRGRCDCSNAAGWTQDGNWTMYCTGAMDCYGKQKFDSCVGKNFVGDGTWCQNDTRHTKCIFNRGKAKIFAFL